MRGATCAHFAIAPLRSETTAGWSVKLLPGSPARGVLRPASEPCHPKVLRRFATMATANEQPCQQEKQ